MNKQITLPGDVKYTQATKLRAGDITAVYEEGRIRYLSARSTEIIRTIYPAIRDENWTTILPVIRDEKIDARDRSFFISYTALYQQDNIQYKAFYTITGGADSDISFSMKGEALSTFKKRRIGFCTLHPIASCAGRDIEVIQPDGKSYSASFPEFVSPFQPFLNIRGMKWITANNIFVAMDYEGDVFETEDQRNWSDNSYKTYSTPLTLPAPATVNKGDFVEQRVTVKVDLQHALQATVPKEKEIKRPLPKIGYAKLLDQQLSSIQVELLKKIPLDHYTVQLDLNGDWKKTWTEAVKETQQLGTSIELFIKFNKQDDGEVAEVINLIRPNLRSVSSILILSEHQETAPLAFFEKTYAVIKHALGNIKTGYGTAGNFAEINRNRPGHSSCDFINFHLHPQVHMTDSRSIMENLGSHETLIRSAAKFSDGKPVHVSPVQFSGDASDRRFHTAFAAWWTLQALRNLSAAESLTFYAAAGAEGILDGERTTPLYDALKAIKDFSATDILQHTGPQVVFQNQAGERLVFTSAMEPLS